MTEISDFVLDALSRESFEFEQACAQRTELFPGFDSKREIGIGRGPDDRNLELVEPDIAGGGADQR